MSDATPQFGTTINCMDGRALFATIDWMKKEFHLDFVDAITEPGMDALITRMDAAARAWLKRKIEISVLHHGSRIVSLVGHDDCAGNPVSPEEHKTHIKEGVEEVRRIIKEIDPTLTVEVIGLWAHATVDTATWTVEKI